MSDSTSTVSHRLVQAEQRQREEAERRQLEEDQQRLEKEQQRKLQVSVRHNPTKALSNPSYVLFLAGIRGVSSACQTSITG